MSAKITIEDGRYTVGLGMGEWVVSVEPRGFARGTVRTITGVLMEAWMVRPTAWWNFGKVEACWSPVLRFGATENSPQAMAEWRARL